MKKCMLLLTATCALFALPSDKSIQVAFRHLEPKGVGFSDGYTTGDLFFVPPNRGSFYPYVNLRGHVFNSGRFAANAGAGLRYQNNCRIFGGNFYYDYRRGQKRAFNQLAFGLEWMNSWFDLYANGYLVVCKDQSSIYDLSFESFVGHSLIASYKREVAMSGADATFRIHCFQAPKWDLSIDISPYYYHPPMGKSLFGGKVSLGAKLANIGFVEGTCSYDRVFNWIGQAIFGIQFALGKSVKSEERICRQFPDRAVQPPAHNEIIVLNQPKEKITAINPSTGDPYYFIFVNNTHPFSDGSWGDPFGTLVEAQDASKPYDIIYVMEGDGTSNRMSNGISLQNFQQLFGSGIVQSIVTQQGTIQIPAQTAGFPLITNTGGSGYAVSLQNSNTVSGIYIDSPTNEAIYGSGITNATISNNIITNDNGTAGAGIDIEGPGMNGSFLIQNNIITDSSGMNGIYLKPMSNDVCTLTLSGNYVNVFENAVEIITLNNSVVSADIFNNSFIATKPDKALFLQPKESSYLRYVINGNTCSAPNPGSNNAGLLIQGHDNSYSTGVVSNNKFINSENGFTFDSGSNAPFFMYANIFNNQFENNTTHDFLARISANKSGILCFGLRKNIAKSTGPTHNYTFNFNNNDGGQMNLTFDLDNVGSFGSVGNATYTTSPVCP